MVSTEIIKNWGEGQKGGALGGHLPPFAPSGAATANDFTCSTLLRLISSPILLNKLL